MIAELRGVTKTYGSIVALDDLTLGLEAGRVTAILGPNGAGKTTAIKLLLGLTRPTTGHGRALRDRSTLACGAAAHGRDAADREGAGNADRARARRISSAATTRPRWGSTAALAAAELTGVADRKYGNLSGGQRQRVQFALAICGNPDLLFLDEPTVGLDVESRRGFWQQIRRLASSGRTIVLTTHYLEEADALADRVVMLSAGSIVADGAPHQIKARVASTAHPLRDGAARRGNRSHSRACSSVRRDGSATEIMTSDAERVVRQLLLARCRRCRVSRCPVRGWKRRS